MTKAVRNVPAGVAKALIRVDGQYLMARKKAPGSPKDNRLEHLGGHLEAGETPFQGLVRELSEEDDSGLLAAAAKRRRPRPKRVTLHHRGSSEDQFLFTLSIEPQAVKKLKPNLAESYDFELVPAAALDTDDGLSSIKPRLTPKTIAIYEAMGRTFEKRPENRKKRLKASARR